MDLSPTLTGEKLLLRPLREDDFDALYASASDPLIWEQHPQKNRYEREVFRSFFDGGLASRGALVAVDRATSEVVGEPRFYDFSEERRQVTVGYTFLVRRYWGGDANREIKHLMLRHAFRYVDRVRFEIGASNLRSRRAIEKLGAVLVREETLDDHAHVVYEIARQDDEATRAAGEPGV